jgi:hypothetical protein
MLNNKIKNIEYLLKNYSTKSKSEIMSDTGLSWSYIQKLTCLNNIKREKNESSNDWKFKKLTDYNDNISMYWLGFMIADGHIYKRDRIQINLSIKDKNHLLKIQEHIGKIPINLYDKQIRASISDRKTTSKLSDDFKWISNKTKNPVDIPDYIQNDALFSLIVGFIDGDGTVNKKGQIFIKCDSSWKENLEYFYYQLTGKNKSFNITKKGLSIIYILDAKNLFEIKKRAENLNLPLMCRKWDRIKIRHIKSDKRDIVKKLLDDVHSINDIVKKTRFSISFIYKIKREIERHK